ncbi:MAG: hypothetical protein EKK62_04055 [Acidimicrobiia bacterium]|nr:MAG: hypothetical protein EKK62_04055 [Acidimicrobiia bacterium]
MWESKGGKLRVKVEKVAPPYKGSSWLDVYWTGVNRCESGKCGEHNFLRVWKLVERDGKAVV